MLARGANRGRVGTRVGAVKDTGALHGGSRRRLGLEGLSELGRLPPHRPIGRLVPEVELA